MRIIIDQTEEPTAIDDVNGFLLFAIRGDEITIGGHFADLDDESLKIFFSESYYAFENVIDKVWEMKEFQ